MINPPTDVQANRTNFTSISVSWSAPTVITSSVAGYEVFYRPEDSDGTYSGQTVAAMGNSQSLLLSSLCSECGYSIFVVAYGNGNVLPSQWNTITISPGEKWNKDCVVRLN